MSNLAYFGIDGNYGSAEGLVIVDTKHFTADDFDQIDEALDDERGRVALEISQRYADSH